MIKETDRNHNKYIKELKTDIYDYSSWEPIKDLILFTYDPEKRTTDVNHFKELEGPIHNRGVEYMVHSILVS